MSKDTSTTGRWLKKLTQSLSGEPQDREADRSHHEDAEDDRQVVEPVGRQRGEADRDRDGARPAEHRPRLSRCLRRSSGQTPAARFYSLCRTAGTAWSYPYSFACRPLTIAAIVISALSLVSMVLRALNPCALRLPSRRPCPCTELALGLRRYYSVSGRRIISERNGPLPLDPRIPSFSATLKSPRQSLGKYEY